MSAALLHRLNEAGVKVPVVYRVPGATGATSGSGTTRR